MTGHETGLLSLWIFFKLFFLLFFFSLYVLFTLSLLFFSFIFYIKKRKVMRRHFSLVCYYLEMFVFGHRQLMLHSLSLSPLTFIIQKEQLEHPAKHLLLKAGANRFWTAWVWGFHFFANYPFISHGSPLRCSHIFNNSAFTNDHQSLCFIGAVDLLKTFIVGEPSCRRAREMKRTRDSWQGGWVLRFPLATGDQDQVRPQIRLIPELPVIDG